MSDPLTHMGQRRGRQAPVDTTPPGPVEKDKLASAWLTYPLAKFNSLTARPLSALLALLRFTPNQVTLLSLAVSVIGLLYVATGDWAGLLLGVALVHLGLVLDHADGQVARRRGMSSEWGMYLDMVVDRVVEAGLVLAVAVATMDGFVATKIPLLPDPVLLVPAGTVILAISCLAAMFLWRFLNAYNDVLYLRSHLRATGRAPTPEPRASASGGRFPVFNRDWVFMIWLVGLVAGQPHAMLGLLLLLHLLVCLGKIIAFARNHQDPEGRAAAVLDPDYH